MDTDNIIHFHIIEPEKPNADDVKSALRAVPSMDSKMNENAQLHESLVSDQFLRARTAEVALNPTQRIPFTLIEHHVLSPDRSGFMVQCPRSTSPFFYNRFNLLFPLYLSFSIRLRFSLKHPQQVSMNNISKSPKCVCMCVLTDHDISQRLGLPVGQHLMVAAKIDDKLVIRAYTPISRCEYYYCI